MGKTKTKVSKSASRTFWISKEYPAVRVRLTITADAVHPRWDSDSVAWPSVLNGMSEDRFTALWNKGIYAGFNEGMLSVAGRKQRHAESQVNMSISLDMTKITKRDIWRLSLKLSAFTEDITNDVFSMLHAEGLW
jgi:hypothetical protein